MDARPRARVPRPLVRLLGHHAPTTTCSTCPSEPASSPTPHNIRPGGFGVPMMISMDDPEHKRRRMLVSKGFTPKRVRDKTADLRRDRATRSSTRSSSGASATSSTTWPATCRSSSSATCSASRRPIGCSCSSGPSSSSRARRVTWLRSSGPSDAFQEYWELPARGDRGTAPAAGRRPGVGAGRGRDRRRPARRGVDHLGVPPHPHRRRRDHPSRAERRPRCTVRATRPARRARRPTGRCCRRAVEEMLRWVSPIKSMSRRVTADVELRGQALREGDDVLLFYPSANRDAVALRRPVRVRHPP